MKKHCAEAFTLIEILIVIVIISIITTVALLSFNDFGKNRRIATAAERLYLQLSYAQQQAQLLPATFALQPQKNQYKFYQLINKSWKMVTNDRVLTTTKLAKNITIKISSKKSQIVFLPSGDVPPFFLAIFYNNKPTGYKIINNNSTLELWENRRKLP